MVYTICVFSLAFFVVFVFLTQYSSIIVTAVVHSLPSSSKRLVQLRKQKACERSAKETPDKLFYLSKVAVISVRIKRANLSDGRIINTP